MRLLLERVLYEERGGVIVIVVGFLPVAIALAAFVIDVGNGMEHRRHLQLQADAGAYAAAPEFNACRNNPDDANEAIAAAARNYADDRNVLLGDDEAQGRVRTVINGTGYEAADNSLGTPCETGFVDVKLREEDSPAFFAFVGNHDYTAHARVQIFDVQWMDGLLPLAMPVPDPRRAEARFVDETNGGAPILDVDGDPIVAELVPAGDEDGLAIWKTGILSDDGTITPNPVDVPIPSEHVGVRIVLSGGGSTVCTDTLVTCYDEGSLNGLLHIQGWSEGVVDQRLPDGPQDPPHVRSVELEPGTNCEDPYFSSPSKPCEEIRISASVNFGGDPTNVAGSLTAVVGGRDYVFPPLAGAGPYLSGAIPIPANAGPVDIELKWVEKKGKIAGQDCTKGQGCKGSFPGIVQRHFSAVSERSGPIELAEVTEASSAANSFEEGATTHPLEVKIGIAGELELAAPNSAEPQYMRIAGDSGSQTQALDCNANGAGDFRWEIVLGCTALYKEHQGVAPWAPCPPDVSGMAQPWQCVEVTTGDRTNNPAAALNERILGDPQPSVCSSPNNWPYDPDDPPIPAGDPRKISIFLTRFNAFEGREGNFTVPITGFATFYITGWTSSGGGFANPCQEEGQGDEIPRDAGEIVGRYIPSVETPNDGGEGGVTCTFDDINPCTAVLVD